MHISLRSLEVFHAVMEMGSVSKAADFLNLTRPAVSIALSKFEQELGFQLFHRSKGYFEPTDEAHMLHHETEQGLLSIERIKTRVSQIRAGGVGVINIASNGACSINLLPRVISQFQRVHTGVQIQLLIRSSRKIASWVAGRQSDIGLIDAPAPIPGLNAEIIRSRCVAVVPQEHPLAREPVLYPHHLHDQSIIAITGDHSIDRQVDSICAAENVTIHRRVFASYFAIARNLVSAGAGLAVIDAVNGKADLGDGIVWRPFEPAIYFELAILTNPEQILSLPAQAFLSDLRRALPSTLTDD
jgi:DNA-binding transcriptional LysR family regulator